jgi:hypothetical protein
MELKEKYSSICALLNKAISDFELSLHADFSKYNALETDWIKMARFKNLNFVLNSFGKRLKYIFLV